MLDFMYGHVPQYLHCMEKYSVLFMVNSSHWGHLTEECVDERSNPFHGLQKYWGQHGQAWMLTWIHNCFTSYCILQKILRLTNNCRLGQLHRISDTVHHPEPRLNNTVGAHILWNKVGLVLYNFTRTNAIQNSIFQNNILTQFFRVLDTYQF